MKRSGRNVNITLSMPSDLKRLLFSTIEKGKISKFVNEALRHALDERRNALIADYIAAAHDPANKEVAVDWSSLDQEDFQGIEDFEQGSLDE